MGSLGPKFSTRQLGARTTRRAQQWKIDWLRFLRRLPCRRTVKLALELRAMRLKFIIQFTSLVVRALRLLILRLGVRSQSFFRHWAFSQPFVAQFGFGSRRRRGPGSGPGRTNYNGRGNAWPFCDTLTDRRRIYGGGKRFNDFKQCYNWSRLCISPHSAFTRVVEGHLERLVRGQMSLPGIPRPCYVAPSLIRGSSFP